jgi:hypothetical protein
MITGFHISQAVVYPGPIKLQQKNACTPGSETCNSISLCLGERTCCGFGEQEGNLYTDIQPRIHILSEKKR